MRNLWQACLWQLSQFNRLNQSFPGRWRLCEFIQRHSAHLASLPAGPTKVAHDTFLYLNPQEKFDGLKTIIHGLNPREPLSNVALQLLRPGDNALSVPTWATSPHLPQSRWAKRAGLRIRGVAIDLRTAANARQIQRLQQHQDL